MKKLVVFVIEIYQKYLSPLKGRTCRFHPTCSEYSKIAISKYGCFKGTILGIKRLLKCHPFHPGGHDPVP